MATPKLHTPAPPLDGVRDWRIGAPVTIEQLKGAPFLVHFWSVDCAACHDQLPGIADWEARYEERGLRLISIHVPMDEEPPEDDLIEGMFTGHDLSHRLAIDDTGYVSAKYGVSTLPAYFLFDGSGQLRHYHSGAKADASVSRAIERLLQEEEGAHAATERP